LILSAFHKDWKTTQKIIEEYQGYDRTKQRTTIWMITSIKMMTTRTLGYREHWKNPEINGARGVRATGRILFVNQDCVKIPDKIGPTKYDGRISAIHAPGKNCRIVASPQQPELKNYREKN
jgi:hypothetical protein